MQEYFLTEAPIGEILQVVNIIGDEEFKRLIGKIGIHIGSEIIKLGSSTSHVHVRVSGREVFLTCDMAQRIVVRRHIHHWKLDWWRRPILWIPDRPKNIFINKVKRWKRRNGM